VNRRKLGVLLFAGAACVLASCNSFTVANFQAKLDDDFAGGCLERRGSFVFLVGFLSTGGPDNIHVSLHDIDDGPDQGTVTKHSVPGVPVEITKCFNSFGQLRQIAVVTSDGMIHVIAHPSGAVTTLGDSGMFAVAGLEFAEGSEDGRKNVVVYGEGGGPFSAAKVFIDDGDGTYSVGGFPPGLASVTSLALLDADADGDEDIMLGLGSGANNMRTYLYDGAGAYVSGPVYGVPQTVAAMGSEDLDGDGDRDIVVASAVPTQNGVVSVFVNNSDGTVTLSDSEGIGMGPARIAFGDLNIDDHPDAGIVNGVDDTVTILFGEAGATFESSSTHLIPDGVADIAFSDVGPGDYPFVDLVVFSSFEDVGVVVLGDGEDLLSEQLGEMQDSIGVVSFAVANFDESADGVQEVVALAIPSDTGTQPYDLSARWWDVNAHAFGSADPALSVNATGPLALGDLDGVDGPDLAAPGVSGGVEVLLNNGAGGFSLATKTIDTGPLLVSGVGFTTIDDNLSVDAAVSFGGTSLGTWFNNGDGTFTAGPVTPAPATTMALGHDADLTARLCLAHTALTIVSFYVMLSDGTPVMTDAVSTDPIRDFTRVHVGDWDGDLDDDFVAVSNGNPALPVYIVVFVNDGAGGFTATTLFTGERTDGWNILDATIADLDGDGAGDVAFVNDGPTGQDQFVGVIYHDGTRGVAGNAVPAESYLAGIPSGDVAVADMSADGRPWVISGKRGLRSGVSALPSRGAPETSGCSAADLAEPFGVLDFNDVLAFLVGFGAMDAASDLAEPFGEFDFNDVLAFLVLFGSGCP